MSRAPVPHPPMKSRTVDSTVTDGGSGSGISTQANPGSIWQVLEHPSPLKRFPSSHCSPGWTTSSPHTAAQTPFVQLGSRVQSGAQPSPTIALPSSHSSSPCTMPSPHTVAAHGAPGVGQ
jgi:hypothetical protein